MSRLSGSEAAFFAKNNMTQETQRGAGPRYRVGTTIELEAAWFTSESGFASLRRTAKVTRVYYTEAAASTDCSGGGCGGGEEEGGLSDNESAWSWAWVYDLHFTSTGEGCASFLANDNGAGVDDSPLVHSLHG